jgi:type III pantothenate kinase
VKLLLDVGNSRIKSGTLQSGSVSGRDAVAYSATDAARVMRGICAGLPRPEAVWVSNVGGAAIGAAVAAACAGDWGLEPRFAAAAAEAFGVRNGYREPAQLGVDRWLALLAAYAAFGGPVCVINCGTAVTVDVVDEGGMHLGGFVVPGVESMARSLAAATDGVRVTAAGPPAAALGRSTRECVRNGTCMALAALFERTLEQFVPGSGGAARCVISGGAAPELMPFIRNAVTHEPDLVLRGLALLAGDS